MKGVGIDIGTHPLRRHRRDRHVRHCRGHAQHGYSVQGSDMTESYVVDAACASAASR